MQRLAGAKYARRQDREEASSTLELTTYILSLPSVTD